MPDQPNQGADVVANIHYGGAYKDKLERAAATGQCIFCSEDFQKKMLHEGNSAVGDHGWLILHNNYPATDREGGHPAFQLLVVSKEHRDDTAPLNGLDWVVITFLVETCKKELGVEGGCYFFRDGDPTISGRTVRHTHVHYYVPRLDKNGRPIPIDVPVG